MQELFKDFNQGDRLWCQMYMKTGYRCQEIPLEVTGVKLTFEDLKFMVDWSGSGEVEPGCIFLASPEEKSMV